MIEYEKNKYRKNETTYHQQKHQYVQVTIDDFENGVGIHLHDRLLEELSDQLEGHGSVSKQKLL